jgi:hypothetical protein
MTNIFIAVLKISAKPVPFIIEKVRTIILMLTGNANYTTPNPTLATLTAQTNNLDKSYQLAINGGKDKKAQMRIDLQTLKMSLNILLAYVQTTSGGDEAKILSSGFEVKRKRTPVGILPPPPNVRCDYGKHEGEVIVRHDGVPQRMLYKYQSNDTIGDDSKWQDLPDGLTGKKSIVAGGLTSGKNYGFRVATISAAGISGWSDPSFHKAA